MGEKSNIQLENNKENKSHEFTVRVSVSPKEENLVKHGS